MSKLPLIHFKGALFHITVRGNNKRQIYHDQKSDFPRYIRNIESCQKKLPFKLYSFVLMPNHLHLLIEVDRYPINKIMQVLQTSYTMYFNIKYHQTGHLFQGRYHSFLVDKESYLLELVRYIHLNPIRAELAENPADYPWSSHLVYLNRSHKLNKIIDRDFILSQFSENPVRQIKLFNEFVLAGVGNTFQNSFPEVTWGQIIGKKKFIHSLERKFKKIKSRLL